MLVLRSLGKANMDEDVPIESTYYEFRLLIHKYNEVYEDDLFKKTFQDIDIKEKSEKDNGMEGLFAVNYNNSSPIYLTNSRIYFALRSYDNKFDFTIPVIGYYDLDGNLAKTTTAIPDIDKTAPMVNDDRSAEGFLAHLNGNPFLYPIQPFRDGDYYIQFGRDPVPEDKENTVFGNNLIYDKDFESVRILRMNKILFSLYDQYLYHQLPLEKSDTQFIERYYFEF